MPRPPAHHVSGLVLVDLVARLAAPASVWGLAQGWTRAAVVAAVLTSALGVGRGLLAGRVAEAQELRMWRALVAALASTDVVTLSKRSEDEQTWRLVDAAQRQVELDTGVLPRNIANAIALVVAVAVVWFELGLRWVLVGGAGLGLLTLLVAPGQRVIRAAQQRVHQHLTEAGADLDVLLQGAAEVRVHGRESVITKALLRHAAEGARSRRKAQTHSAVVGLLPLGLMLLGITLPAALGLVDLASPSEFAGQLARAGVVGGAGFVFALALARGIEAYAHAAPHRQLLASVFSSAGALVDEGSTTSADMPARIVLRSVTFKYPGAARSTPMPVTHAWRAPGGLALVGGNGSGKTTLALCILRLLKPTDGEVDTDVAPSQLRARAVYLPQTPYVAPERTVRWHLNILIGVDAADDQVEAALCEVGLLDALNRHDEASALDVRLAALSGGERRRLALARLTLPQPQQPWLYVLDEPEAGLDSDGRVWLAAQLGRLAQEAFVLLVAHDRSIIPDAFDVVECRHGAVTE